MWFRSELSWTTPPKSCTTISSLRCSISWPNHIRRRAMKPFTSKQVEPQSPTLPGPSPKLDYFLRRTREFADHRGTNGPPQEGDLRYLHQLPQNQLGISCQNFGGKLRPTSELDKKRSRHPASQLNFPATDSSDISLRLPTRTNYNHMPFEFVLLTSTRLARDKTPRGSWPFAGHQNASGPNREEATKFNACVLWPASRGAKTVQRR